MWLPIPCMFMLNYNGLRKFYKSYGKQFAAESVPALKAPLNLKPKTTDITFKINPGMNLKGCRVIIDPDKKLREITRLNNTVFIR